LLANEAQWEGVTHKDTYTTAFRGATKQGTGKATELKVIGFRHRQVQLLHKNDVETVFYQSELLQ
jgi:hypothetical protein